MNLTEGTTALVTGASSGIGAELAKALAARKVTVGLVARRKDRLEQVLEECKGAAPESRIWAADLGDLDLAEHVAIEAWDAFGHVDVLVNNAGIPKRRHVTELSYDEVEEVMRVNFLSPMKMSLALLPRMLERGKGSIVNVSSVAGRLGNPREAAYCASKFALCGWSEAMNVDLWDTPIEIRLVNPGAIDTEIWDLPGEDAPIYEGEKEPPNIIAGGIVTAIEGDKFEHYLPDMKPFVDAKQADIDGFMAGAVEWVKSVGR
ncbi:MAG TPA: SDR family NAD(P)-dependent oxidoreductase [Acidimicrobiales bacterium]|nr:SDR family NAD(P)-dependent oxidoreductase [Acidimicrobiales bacterium]